MQRRNALLVSVSLFDDPEAIVILICKHNAERSGIDHTVRVSLANLIIGLHGFECESCVPNST